MSFSRLNASTELTSSATFPTDNNQLARLASFLNWPMTSQVSPLTLARNGFVYDGIGDRTRCVFCKLAMENWTHEDKPFEVHQSKSPECPFVVGGLDQLAFSGQTSTSGGVPGQTVENSSSFTAPAETPSKRMINIGLSTAAGTEDSRIPIDRSNADDDRLKTESVRLATFHDWPSRAADVVDPCDLATAGLFYTGQADRVQCAFCRGVIRNWVHGDIPMEEHRKHFPDCHFVRETAAEKGSSRSDGDSVDRSPVDLKEDTLTTANSYRLLTTSSASNVRLPRPVHPDFADVSKRKASFRGVQLPRGQTVDVLAEAGFFHVGPHDNVRCFQCDGGLKNWQPDDAPWTEHARWFPRCPFLLANKDRILVQNSQTFEGRQHVSGNRQVRDVNPERCKGSHQSAGRYVSDSTTDENKSATTENANRNSDTSLAEADELLAENLQLKESRTCKVCMDEEVNTVFLPCGHLVCCSNCSPALRHCAICRTLIRGTVRIFLG